MGKALYRKYRPVSLEQVVGQDTIVTSLKESLDRKNISHAYLFIGPRGCGKTSVARIFAHAINGFKYELEDSYVDIVEIDAASNTGVDNIRDLREKAVIAPAEGKYKVYIIDEVHMLSKSAFNALLKILEEPPAHVVFILATTDPEKVPVTITSRAQTYMFKLSDPDTMFTHLSEIAKQEKIPITDDALRIVVTRGGGSFRDSISLLDQISNLSNKKITAEMLTAALGLPADKILDELLATYASTDVVKITALIKDLMNSGTKPEAIASALIDKIIAKPENQYLSLLAKLPTVTAPFAEAKLLVALLGDLAKAPRVYPPVKSEAHIPDGASESAAPTTVPPAAQNTAPAAKKSPLDWGTYLSSVKSQSALLGNLLAKIPHQISTDTLHLFPDKPTTKNLLEHANNKKVLLDVLAPTNYQLEIHEPGESQGSTPAEFSGIMGPVQEVTNGGNPFNK